MAQDRPPRSTRALIRVGLVLVGLCAGILLMLVWIRAGGVQVVEHVELGRPDGAPGAPPVAGAPARAAARDSGAAPGAWPLMRLNTQFREIARRVTPSVVYIMVTLGEQDDPEGERERFFRGPPAPRQSVGSGVIVSDEGYIVTNHHVINGARDIQVVLADKRQYEAHVVGTDASTDLAVLEIDAEDLPVLPFGNSDHVQVGEWVIAVGNPFRLTSTVTAGIVGALGRRVNIIEGSDGIEDFIQTDAAISPGNSGGALVNLRGELVGINTAIASRSGWYEGYGFAVPVNLMERVARDLIEYGHVRRGYLGVTIDEVDAQTARRLGMDQIRGVLVRQVRPQGAAYEAGLRAGDVVLSVGERAVDAPNGLQSLVASYRPGEHVRLTIWREGTTRRVEAELRTRDEGWLSGLRAPEPEAEPEERPDAPGPEPRPTPDLLRLEAWGLGLRPATDQERAAFGRGGAYVAYVEQGSPAAAAGLPRGVLLTAVEEAPVASVEEAVQRLGRAEGPAVLLRVRRQNGLSAFYEVEVP